MAANSVFSIWNTIDVVSNPSYALNTKVNVLWYSYQAIVFIPMLIITLIKVFKKQISDEDLLTSKKLPGNYLDTFSRLFSLIGLVYYVTNSLLICPLCYIPCKMISICHHLATLLGAAHVIQATYYPWFLLAPLTMHSLLLMYPEIKLFNYIYILLVGICFYGLSQKPYSEREEYKKVRLSIILLIFPLLGFWLLSCNNKLTLD